MRRYAVAGLRRGLVVGGVTGLLLVGAVSLSVILGGLKEESLLGVLGRALLGLGVALGLGVVAGAAGGAACGLVASRIAARVPRALTVLVVSTAVAMGVLWLAGSLRGTFTAGSAQDGGETVGAIEGLIFQVLVLVPSLVFGVVMAWWASRAGAGAPGPVDPR